MNGTSNVFKKKSESFNKIRFIIFYLFLKILMKKCRIRSRRSLFNLLFLVFLGLTVGRKVRCQGIGDGLEQEGRRRKYAGVRLNFGQERVDAHQFYEVGY